MENNSAQSLKVVAWPAFINKERNPYNFLLYSSIRELSVNVIEAKYFFRKPTDRFDILHIHWPENALSRPPLDLIKKLSILYGLLFIAKTKRAKVVWTVHNLRPHERRYPWLEPVFYRTLVRFIDGVIFLSKASMNLISKDEYMKMLLKKPFAVIPHGHYRDVYPNAVNKLAARQKLGLGEEKVLLFIGQLRPYKGVDKLIVSFKQLPGSGLRLIVAGKPISRQYLEQLEHLIGNDPRILLIPRFINDAEIPILFGAADLVVLPYTSILNSGSAILALSFSRPLLAPNEGSFPELAEEVGPGWVHLYDPPLTSEKLNLAIEQIKKGQKANLEKAISRWSWRAIAVETVKFYDHVISTNKKDY